MMGDVMKPINEIPLSSDASTDLSVLLTASDLGVQLTDAMSRAHNARNAIAAAIYDLRQGPLGDEERTAKAEVKRIYAKLSPVIEQRREQIESS